MLSDPRSARVWNFAIQAWDCNLAFIPWPLSLLNRNNQPFEKLGNKLIMQKSHISPHSLFVRIVSISLGNCNILVHITYFINYVNYVNAPKQLTASLLRIYNETASHSQNILFSTLSIIQVFDTRSPNTCAKLDLPASLLFVVCVACSMEQMEIE